MSGGVELTIGLPAGFARQLIIFERGHWCSSCRRHLTLLAENVAAFRERGIVILAVTHEEGRDLLGRDYPFPVLGDPHLELAATYDAAGIDEAGKHTIRPAAIVVDRAGRIEFSYVGDDSRDRPTIPALLLAIDHLK